MAAFVLPIQDIGESGHDWTFSIDSAWLTRALDNSGLHAGEGVEPGTLQVRAYPTGTDFLVQSRIQTRVFTPCARCLEDVPLDLDLQVSSLMSHESARVDVPEDEQEFDPNEPTQDYFSGTEIVLDDIVREHIILEDPMQPLCSEDCPGIEIPAHVRPPDDFGKEAAVDPRLAPLAELRRNLPPNEE